MEMIIGLVLVLLLFLCGGYLWVVFMMAAGLILIIGSGMPVSTLASMCFSTVDSYVLVAAPLFVFAGYLMIRGGLSDPLVNLFKSFTGHFPGGLAIGAIIAAAFVGAMTASSTATLVAVGIIMFPAMLKAGYDRGFAAGTITSSSGLGYLIPPSLFFIIYGFLTLQDVSVLFVAGVIPGLIMAAILCVCAFIIAKVKHMPTFPPVPWKERGKLLVSGIPALLMPVVVLGGIYAGIFTPTEAGGVACAYTFAVGAFYYRKLNWKTFKDTLTETTDTVGKLFLMVAAGMILGRAFTLLGLAQNLTNWVVNSGLGPIAFLLLFNFVFIFLGSIMEGLAITILTLPIILPATQALGINAIFLGVVFCMNLIVDAIAPPMAMSLFMASALFQTPFATLLRGIIPMFIALLIALVIFTVFPQLSLWLPGVIFGD